MDIVIPNLGDIDEVEVIELCVAEGDEVGPDDTLLVIESDKASMDVPVGAAGIIEKITVALGDMVSEGSVVATLRAEEPSASEGKEPSASEGKEPSASESKEPSASESKEPSASEGKEPSASENKGKTESELDILVPDIGDASGVVVIEINVSAGDVVAFDDLLVVLESDKASMEITSEYAGTVVELLVEQDQEVEAGTPIARIRVESDEPSASKGKEPSASEGKEPSASENKEPSASKGKEPSASENKEPSASKGKEPSASEEKEPSASEGKESSTPEKKPTSSAGESTTGSATVYAGPATRRLARELGVDLSQVKGTGQRQRILKDDVKAYVKKSLSEPASSGSAAEWPSVAEVNYEKFGEIELSDLSRIRQRGATNLHRSWVNLPHVTQHDEVDITDLEEFRSGLKAQAETRGVRVTPLAFIVKACAIALREHPEFNSSLHANGKQLVLKKYINIGMAVDTPEGLVVPVIRDADSKDIWSLSSDIASLSDRARNKKLGMDDLQGGTFSISSLGALGGTGFTPIVNAPEVAILGVSKLATKPIWNGAEFTPRKMLPLSLSYDHRVINGADGGRFMLRLVELLGDLRQMALS